MEPSLTAWLISRFACQTVKTAESSFNQNLLTSCNTLIELLKTNNIYIDDLQFLLSETGELFISDPRDIYLSPPDKNIDIVKNIRSYALNNLLDENDD